MSNWFKFIDSAERTTVAKIKLALHRTGWQYKDSVAAESRYLNRLGALIMTNNGNFQTTFELHAPDILKYLFKYTKYETDGA